MVAEEQKRELLEFAVQMARRVGAIHLEWFRRSDLEIGTKSNEFDVVTRADRESEACIARMVAERLGAHVIEYLARVRAVGADTNRKKSKPRRDAK